MFDNSVVGAQIPRLGPHAAAEGGHLIRPPFRLTDREPRPGFALRGAASWPRLAPGKFRIRQRWGFYVIRFRSPAGCPAAISIGGYVAAAKAPHAGVFCTRVRSSRLLVVDAPRLWRCSACGVPACFYS